MARSDRVRLADFRKIVQLIGECRDLGDDPLLWRLHVAAGIAHLTGGLLCFVGEFGRLDQPKSNPYIVDWGWGNGLDREGWLRLFSEMRIDPLYSLPLKAYWPHSVDQPGIGLARCDVLDHPTWYRSSYYQDWHRPFKIDEILYSVRPMELAPGRYSGFCVARAQEDRQFSGRQKAIIGEINAVLAPLIGGALAGITEPAASALPKRSQEVLQCLLQGDGDKQVAKRLGISTHTVNGHLKVIFRHFSVQSRSELLARWVRRGWKLRAEPGPASDDAP